MEMRDPELKRAQTESPRSPKVEIDLSNTYSGNLIVFNDPRRADQRSETKSLTLTEELRAARLIDTVLSVLDNQGVLSEEDLELIQRFIWHYENLCYYRSTHYDPNWEKHIRPSERQG